MNQTILVPLDGSAEAEKMLVLAQRFLPPGGRGILLRVLPATEKAGDRNRREHAARLAGALGYLRCVVGHLVDAQGRWRCAVVVADSVAQGIADFAAREEVDLIAMYTHDRKGLAKLIRGNITEKVQRRALMEVQVFKAEELVVS